MDEESLVDYYRRKLLERYAECMSRDIRVKIADLLRTANEETLAEIIQLLESKK